MPHKLITTQEELDAVKQRGVLIAYLRMKADQEDWHGVSDAANDLRELDVRISWLRSE